MMKRLNKIGPPVLRGLPVPPSLPFERLETLLAEGATVVDTRPASAFAATHFPGTINIPHNNDFTSWAGWLLAYDQPFYLISASSNVQGVRRDLTYIGLDNVGGYFEPALLNAWHPLQTYANATPVQIAAKVAAGEVIVVDVRNDHEWQAGHIPGARHLMLGYLPERMSEIPTDKPVLVQCQSGVRSAIGASILQAKGILNVMNLSGGINAWAAAGLPVER
jgi:hydroxyacylglutathione hydrolase